MGERKYIKTPENIWDLVFKEINLRASLKTPFDLLHLEKD